MEHKKNTLSSFLGDDGPPDNNSDNGDNSGETERADVNGSTRTDTSESDSGTNGENAVTNAKENESAGDDDYERDGGSATESATKSKIESEKQGDRENESAS